MTGPAATLARQLAASAEAVCRHYLPQGRRQGRYWIAGDLTGAAGRSLFVRLSGGPDGAAGKWSDAATGEHGDLLDLIAGARRYTDLRETLDEARRFLALPQPDPRQAARPPMAEGSSQAAKRLWALARPIRGTLAARYLEARGIADHHGTASLRYLPNCWYRPDRDDAPGTRTSWPALIAAVRAADGSLRGIQRTWLDPSGTGKAPVATPRRAIGRLHGNGVWLGQPATTLVAGEGIETILSLRQALPGLPMTAALSAAHLGALILPPDVRRLYIARDNDLAGDAAFLRLAVRARDAGVAVRGLGARHGDFNDDLRRLGRAGLAAGLIAQLAPEDRPRLTG